MKKILLLVFLFSGLCYYGQDKFYLQIIQRLKAENPQLVTDDKLIVINVWSAADAASRERNQDLQKTAHAFGSAKLKGGPKGMLGLVICKDDDVTIQTIALEKDKIKGLYAVSAKGLDTGEIVQIIFDSKGNVLSQNFSLPVFTAVNQLITR